MRLIDALIASNLPSMQEIANIPKFVVDNVAEYYYHHDKEYWRLLDFPLARPPFQKMWVEYRVPKSSRSKELGDVTLHNEATDLRFGCLIETTDNGRSFVAVGMYFEMSALKGHQWDRAGSEFFRVKFDLDDNGNLERVHIDKELDNDGVANMLYCYHPILMAFSFASCRNIELVTVTHPEKLQKSRRRKGRLPLCSYKVINILPMGYHRPHSRSIEGSGEGVALQIRRGHYAHYGPQFNRGLLFGKYEGLYWKPQTMVGTAEAGVVVHDYEVKK
jgi:hypothetical protein